jgi:hypothetical protein
LYRFLKKFGLDHIADSAPAPATHPPQAVPAAATPPAAASEPEPSEPVQSQPEQLTGQASTELPGQILLPGPDLVETLIGPAVPAPPFSSDERNTPGPSC